jgi:hypothetical protein
LNSSDIRTLAMAAKAGSVVANLFHWFARVRVFEL